MNAIVRFLQINWADRRLAAVAAFVIGVGGTALYAVEVDGFYPIKQWLFWTFATLWMWVALFSIACLCFGQLVLTRLLRITTHSVVESAVLSMAIGVVAFVLALYVAGGLRLFGPELALGLPLTFIALGAFDGYCLYRRAVPRESDWRFSTSGTLIFALGSVGAFVAYIGIVSPDTINCDAMMVHMKIPEDYARNGRIVGFPGNYQAAVPHLASMLQTWAYLVPGLQKVQHWMLALHLEFGLFLWTLAGVSAAVRQMVGDAHLRGAWVAVFLFPGLYVADANMAGCADHVLAFFSLPIALSVLRCCRSFSRGNCALLGITLAGAFLTKYQAVYLVAGAAIVVGISWMSAFRRLLTLPSGQVTSKEKADLWLAPVIILGVLPLLVSPHFIKNLVFYHNPVYPFMQTTFTGSTPQFPGAVLFVDNLFRDVNWVPQGTLSQRLLHAVQLFFTFSFEPHYSPRHAPYFGSLYTLMLPLLFVGRIRFDELRVAGLGALALLFWALTFNVDRNIQTFMPVLACLAAAMTVKAWRLGWLSRLGVVPLVAFQAVWGADAPLDEAGRGRIASAVELLSSGLEGQSAKRFERYRASYLALTEVLPADARVLLHSAHDSLGIDRELWLDRPGFQGLISYQNVHTPREMYDYLRSLGITHSLQDSREPNPASQRDELLFRIVTHRYFRYLGDFGTYRLARLETPPPVENPYRVLAIQVSGYQTGIYPINALGTVEYLPPAVRTYAAPERALNTENMSSALSEVDAVLLNGSLTLPAEFRSRLDSAFNRFSSWGGNCNVYIRSQR